MTVIVAVSDGKRVCMACDSQATNNGAKERMSHSKIERRGPLLFGCGALFIRDAIRHHMPEPEIKESLEAWGVLEFVPWMRRYLREHELMEKDDGGELMFPANTLVACRGEFVLVDKNTGTLRFAHPFAATGSGWCEARGAMWNELLHYERLCPNNTTDSCERAESVARCGIEVAIALDAGCGPPVHVEWTEP